MVSRLAYSSSLYRMSDTPRSLVLGLGRRWRPRRPGCRPDLGEDGQQEYPALRGGSTARPYVVGLRSACNRPALQASGMRCRCDGDVSAVEGRRRVSWSSRVCIATPERPTEEEVIAARASTVVDGKWRSGMTDAVLLCVGAVILIASHLLLSPATRRVAETGWGQSPSTLRPPL